MKQEISDYVKKMAGRSVAVIRTFNNPFITKQVDSFLKMGFSKVFVVVDVAKDRGSTTMKGGWLRNYFYDPHLQIIEIHQGYSWSIALNSAIEQVFTTNALKGRTIDYVFNVSVEANFQPEHVEKMFQAFKPGMGVVGTTFHGVKDSNDYSLSWSYGKPRNTGMIVSVDVLMAAGPYFNVLCDFRNGQEDWDFILRMMVNTNYAFAHLNLGVGLHVGKNYNQEVKQINEEEAIRLINTDWRSRYALGTAERTRIEHIIQHYGHGFEEE